MSDLRGYQREALDAVTSAHERGTLRPVVVAPAGSGKTRIFCVMAAEHVQRTGERVLIVVNRTELVAQTVRTLATVAPHIGVGVVAGAKDQWHCQVTVAMIQTIKNPKRRRNLNPGLVIVDEVHLLSAPGAFGRTLDAFDCPKAGFTATLVRPDNGIADRWDAVVYSRSTEWAIESGHLCPVDGVRVELLDATHDDDTIESLADALHDQQGEQLILKAWQEHGIRSDGQIMPAIAFLPSIQTAVDLADHVNANGLRAGVVHSNVPAKQRSDTIAAYDAGELDLLSSCVALAVGFDSPRAQCALIARPMAAEGMFLQSGSRVARPYPGKDRALIIDFFASTNARSLEVIIDMSRKNACPCDCSCKGGKSCGCGCEIDGAPCECKGFICDCGCKCKGLSKSCPCICIDGGGEPCRCRNEPQQWEEKEVRDVAYAMTVKELNLFGKSQWIWLTTPAGLKFLIMPDDTVVFLFPETDGLVQVGRGHTRHGRSTPYRVPTDPGQARRWAEDLAEDWLEGHDVAFGVHRGASWRSKPASSGATALAVNLGATVPLSATAGAVSDLIGIAKVSAMLDVKFLRRLKYLDESS